MDLGEESLAWSAGCSGGLQTLSGGVGNDGSYLCVYLRQVWYTCTTKLRLQITDSLEDWWLDARAGFQKKEGIFLTRWSTLTCWSLLKQRNARIFGNLSKQYSEDNLASWKT
jgi:hypothetical protein